MAPGRFLGMAEPGGLAEPSRGPCLPQLPCTALSCSVPAELRSPGRVCERFVSVFLCGGCARQVRDVPAPCALHGGVCSRKAPVLYSQRPGSLQGRKQAGVWVLLAVGLLHLCPTENNHFRKHGSVRQGSRGRALAYRSLPEKKLVTNLYLL